MYRPIETMPDNGDVVSVLTRASNVRGCRFVDGVRQYRSVHREWFDADKSGDPPLQWWDGAIPGSRSGRYRYVDNR